jgi:hypothetical protein
MHSLHSPKPIGKCKGCPLNLKQRCGIFARPGRMWAKGKCRGYKSEKLYARYVEQQARFHAKTPKDLRREGARRRKAEPHYDGIVNPGGARW